MPYSKTSDLSDKIKHILPSHAQEIYMKAFNQAWQEYKDPNKRMKDKNLEETAHSIAWSAVKKKYHKGEDGHWRQNK